MIPTFWTSLFPTKNPLNDISRLFLIGRIWCRVIRIAPFANRLAMNVPPHIQLLRCMANYKALRFSDPISTLAEKLVKRMIEKSSGTGGKYVSIHLRFEEVCILFVTSILVIL